MRRVAVVGGGAAGLAAAFALRGRCAVTLFEAEPRLGGHAHTVEVTHGGRRVAVDVAFMVYNRRNYPRFCALLAALGIEGAETDMSFSVTHGGFGLVYNGGSIGGLLAQPRNLARPMFWRLLAEIVRFNTVAKRVARGEKEVAGEDEDERLDAFLARYGFAEVFTRAYLLPMGASIWSCAPEEFAAAPARFVARFFDNHGLLDLRDRPQWMCIPGGSRRYVAAIEAALPDLRRRGAARAVGDDGAVGAADGGETARFDAVVVAAHAPQALELLTAGGAEAGAAREVLGDFRYTRVRAALHSDEALLPPARRARAAWNYRAVAVEGRYVACPTYHLSRLQRLEGGEEAPLLLTLNVDAARPREDAVIRRFSFSHPLPDGAAIRAQRRFEEVNSSGRVFFCGAYWGNGFHEDAVASGEAAAAHALRFLGGA